MTTTFATSGACLLKAGANINSAFTGASADANWTSYINQAESYINTITKINYTDAYAALNDDVKKILEDCASNIAGTYAISYDMSGFTTLSEAQTMLDVLNEGIRRDIDLLKEKNYTADFISTA